eukprot:PITA_33727
MSNYKKEAPIRPPIFDGSNFVYWKVRTTTYLQSLGAEVLDIVEGGYTFPSATPTDTTGKKQEKHNEKLECEIVGLRKDIEKIKALNLRFAKGSETLDEIIKVQHSPLIKTGLVYTEEASQAQKPSTSKSYLDAARRSEQVDNRQQRHKTNHEVNRGQSTSRMNRSYNQPQVNHSQFASRMNVNGNYNHLDGRFDNRRNFFNGQCFSCHNFGHKATQCVSYKTIMTREARNQRSVTGIMKRTYNQFSILENEIECSICSNFGHEDYECRSKFRQTFQKEKPSLCPKTWRKKELQPERCGIALYAEGQENKWYIDRGCSKHMIVDKEKLRSYSALEKERKVSFKNDTPALIKGKGSVLLKEKVKARNVMYVDGLKHNLLSVSQMCDQGNEIRKACQYQAVRDLPDIRIPDNAICKACQFGKKTRTNFPKKEGSASQPLELVHSDLCGPSRKKSPRGEEYFILFIDDFSRICWIGLLKHKDEALKKFKAFKALVENESDHRIKCHRSDRGGEFTSDEFFNFCGEHGIRREFSTARTPQQNGAVERMNRMV